MQETSGRATEEESQSQDGQTCNKCCMYRGKTKSKFINLTDRKYDTRKLYKIHVKFLWIEED